MPPRASPCLPRASGSPCAGPRGWWRPGTAALLPSLLPQSRRAHSIDLKGTVVIFDEAHNVVSVGVAVARPSSRPPPCGEQ